MIKCGFTPTKTTLLTFCHYIPDLVSNKFIGDRQELIFAIPAGRCIIVTTVPTSPPLIGIQEVTERKRRT